MRMTAIGQKLSSTSYFVDNTHCYSSIGLALTNYLEPITQYTFAIQKVSLHNERSEWTYLQNKPDLPNFPPDLKFYLNKSYWTHVVKKSIIGIIVLVMSLGAFLGIYRIGSPEVVIVNQSSQHVTELIVKLPSNRIVFGSVSPKSESTIFYSWLQAEGEYEYQISFSRGSNQAGKCGYVTPYEIGKRLTLIVRADLTVTCDESSKG